MRLVHAMERGRSGRLLRGLLIGLYLAALVPMIVGFGRKLGSFRRAELYVSTTESGYRVESVGPSAHASGLVDGDVIVLIDGRPARLVEDPSLRLAESGADLTVLRQDRAVRVESAPARSPWSVRYFFLVLVGAVFAFSGLRVLVASGSPGPEALLFSAFSLGLALALVLSPAPPFDAWYRTGVALEDLARALFPALLLQLVFTFPRRARRAPTPLFWTPALALMILWASTYLAPSGVARPRIDRLDHLQAVWMSVAAIACAARLVVLSRRRIDLLTEKQVRFLLLGTAAGLLPLCLLDFLPRLLGGPIPLLSSLSLLPLALVPVAFLAALTRYRLWDVEALGRETTALLGALFFGAGVLAITERVLARAVPADLPYAKGTFQASVGLFLALSFVPIRRGLSSALTRVQYRDVWSDREALLSLVRELPTPRPLSEVDELLSTRVSRGLGVQPAALLLVLADGHLAADRVDGGPPLDLELLPEEVLVGTTRLRRALGETGGPVDRLRRAGFRTVSPLAVSGRLLALFAVGDKIGPTPLSSDDRELLETVLAPAALALDHARLYEELRVKAAEFQTLKEFHEDVVAGSAAAIAATDDAGRFTSLNDAFAQLVGRPKESILGQVDQDVLPLTLLASSGSPRHEVDFGQGPRVLDIAISRFPGAGAGSAAKVIVLQDATETARLERALADRERLAALGTLSAGVAHEVNTPLTGVASYARLLLDDTEASDPKRPFLEKIEEQAFRASRLVGSLLDLARGRPRELAPLEPQHVAREAARSLETDLKGRNVQLILDLPADTPRIAGHEDALVQVLVNLLKNGLEAVTGRPEPRVSLRLGHTGAKVTFQVEDNGRGMTPDEARHAFEPFFSTKKAAGGTGLGLAIAKDIIHAHGGSLDVDAGPGRGSRFTVSLPVMS